MNEDNTFFIDDFEGTFEPIHTDDQDNWHAIDVDNVIQNNESLDQKSSPTTCTPHTPNPSTINAFINEGNNKPRPYCEQHCN